MLRNKLINMRWWKLHSKDGTPVSWRRILFLIIILWIIFSFCLITASIKMFPEYKLLFKTEPTQFTPELNLSQDAEKFGFINAERCRQVKLYQQIKYVYQDKEIIPEDKKNFDEIIQNITSVPFEKENYIPLKAIIVELVLQNGEIISLCLGVNAWSLWDKKISVFKEYPKGYPKFMKYQNREKVNSIIHDLWTREKGF